MLKDTPVVDVVDSVVPEASMNRSRSTSPAGFAPEQAHTESLYGTPAVTLAVCETSTTSRERAEGFSKPRALCPDFLMPTDRVHTVDAHPPLTCHQTGAPDAHTSKVGFTTAFHCGGSAVIFL
jgi:hypothetical protein